MSERFTDWPDLLLVLDAYRVYPCAASYRVRLVEVPRRGVWFLADNGGEFTVAKVNDEDATHVSVPYEGRGGVALPTGTVAYRVAMALLGYPIDWARDERGLVEECKSVLPQNVGTADDLPTNQVGGVA